MNNEIINDSILIAEAFSERFSVIGNSLSSNHCSDLSLINESCRSSFSFRTITPTEVQRIIDGLSSGSSCGLDGLAIKFFKLASRVFSFHCLTYLIYRWPPVKPPILDMGQSNPST